MISDRAHIIAPWHRAIEEHSERSRGAMEIGTTRRGIGPAYAFKADRLGLRLADLLNPTVLDRKLETVLESARCRVGLQSLPEPVALSVTGPSFSVSTSLVVRLT